MASETCRRKVSLTFDVEDYFQVETLRDHYPLHSWDSVPLRLEKRTQDLLNLLDFYDVKATFFVLGWIAQKVPDMVKEIDRRGHEVASHGYSHRLNNTEFFSVEELERDLSDSKSILEKIIGKEVYGYRAPSFSITDEVIKCLMKAGYRYDSSLFPFKLNSKYGCLSKQVMSDLKSGVFTEFEIPLANFLGVPIPFAGGAYFRFLPLWMVKSLTKIVRGNVLVFYFHPWEFDPHQPKVNGLSFSQKLRHYYGLRKNLDRLEDMLRFFKEYDYVLLPLKELCVSRVSELLQGDRKSKNAEAVKERQ